MSEINNKQICNTCHGAKYISKEASDSNGHTWIVSGTCPTCNGTGWQPGGSAS